MSLGDQFVEVTSLGGRWLAHGEVVEDEQAGADKFADALVPDAVRVTTGELGQDAAGLGAGDAGALADGLVAEGLDGDVVGSVYGGCVEGAVCELCQQVLEDGDPLYTGPVRLLRRRRLRRRPHLRRRDRCPGTTCRASHPALSRCRPRPGRTWSSRRCGPDRGRPRATSAAVLSTSPTTASRTTDPWAANARTGR